MAEEPPPAYAEPPPAKKAKDDPKPIATIAIDLEATGSLPGSKIISAGLAMVYPSAEHKKKLFCFARPRFPSTVHGQVFAPVPKTIPHTSDILFDEETGWPVWEGAYLNEKDHAIVDYGDFEPRCWNEFWSQIDPKTKHWNIKTLVQNVDWGQKDIDNDAVWLEIRQTIDKWCIEALLKDHRPRIVSDNPAFDLGTVSAKFLEVAGRCPTSRWKRTVIEMPDGSVHFGPFPEVPPTIHYVPRKIDYDGGIPVPVIGYNRVSDPGEFETAAKYVKVMDVEEPRVRSEHTHVADDDALNIAARYAAYALKYPHAA